MALPNKILVPIDFSVRSRTGISTAAALAAATGASLVLMSNIGPAEQDALMDYAHAERIAVEEAAGAQLRHLGRELAPDCGVTLLVTFFDSAAEAILNTAAAEPADLIVMASHGRSGMTRWMLGSVADKVLRGSDVPVMVVPVRNE